MNLYCHPSDDWAHVGQLLNKSQSTVHQLIASNLLNFQQSVARFESRWGQLLLISDRDPPYATAGVLAVAAPGPTAIVYFYLMSPPYQREPMVRTGVYKAMRDYARARKKTEVRVPVLTAYEPPERVARCQALCVRQRKLQWGGVDDVRAYDIPRESVVELR